MGGWILKRCLKVLGHSRGGVDLKGGVDFSNIYGIPPNFTVLPPHTTHTSDGTKNWPGNIDIGPQGQGNKEPHRDVDINHLDLPDHHP